MKKNLSNKEIYDEILYWVKGNYSSFLYNRDEEICYKKKFYKGVIEYHIENNKDVIIKFPNMILVHFLTEKLETVPVLFTKHKIKIVDNYYDLYYDENTYDNFPTKLEQIDNNIELTFTNRMW